MILKDSFYSINTISEDDSSKTFNVTIDADHPIFNGHFPGNPVTPGVAQLEIIKELVSYSIGTNCKLSEMANCKFLKVLNPKEDAEVSINLKLETAENTVKVNAVIQNDNGVFLKASATYLLL